MSYNIKSEDDPICPSSGCNYPPLQNITAQEPPKRMGNYTTEGNYEYKNITNKPLGDQWNSTAKQDKNESNATNATNTTTLVFMKSDVRLTNETASDSAPTTAGDCSQH